MGKRDIRRAVEAKIDLGYSRQHAYDEMHLEYIQLGVKRLADTVRYVPSLAARQRYRVEQGALLAAIAASVLLQFIHSPAIYGMQTVDAKAFLIAIPIASIAIGIGIFRYHARLYRWLVLLTLYGFFRRMGVVDMGQMEGWTIAHNALALAIVGLAFFLHIKLASKYRIVPGTQPPMVEFPPEPGSMAM